MARRFSIFSQSGVDFKSDLDFRGGTLAFHDFESPDFKTKELKREFATGSLEESSKRLRVNQSWIFTYGYGERVETEEGKRVRCLIPGCGRMYSTSNSSTSNLKKHLQTMHNINEASGEALLASRGDHQKLEALRNALEEFIVGNRISHRAVEDPNLRRLLEMAQSVNINDLYITAENMQEGLIRSALIYKQRLKQLLSTNQCLSLTFDRWVCGVGKYFYGATVHFIDEDWNQREALIAFMESTENHGDRMKQTLVELDILDKVFTVTADYSTEMVGLTSSLVATCPNFKIQNHLPCLSYILTEAISRSLQPSLEFDAVLNKTRQGMAHIKKLPQANVYFHALLLDPNHLIMDDLYVDSCYDMISTVLSATAAYNETCALFGFPQFSLTAEDRMFLAELRHILGMFHSLAESLLTYRYPTIGQTNALYDQIIWNLVYQSSGSICGGSRAVYHSMVKYFSWSHTSAIYPIAVALDPRTKFEYWRKSSFPDSEFLIELVTTVWNRHFRASSASGPQPLDDLQTYISEPTLTAGASDPNCVMDYWRRSSPSLPQLAKMARIFLAIPATSAPSKVLFQKELRRIPIAQDTCSSESLEQYLLLESWKSVCS